MQKARPQAQVCLSCAGSLGVRDNTNLACNPTGKGPHSFHLRSASVLPGIITMYASDIAPCLQAPW